jgi:hypothetical protein
LLYFRPNSTNDESPNNPSDIFPNDESPNEFTTNCSPNLGISDGPYTFSNDRSSDDFEADPKAQDI